MGNYITEDPESRLMVGQLGESSELEEKNVMQSVKLPLKSESLL